MLLAVLRLTFLGLQEAAPSIASLQGLPPVAIGQVLLQGHEHGIVETVTPDRGLDAPGVVKRHLTERPSSVSGGCVRKKWTVSFRQAMGAPESSAVLNDAYAVPEVALPTALGCSNSEFVHVNPGLDAAEALKALQHLRNVRSGVAKVRFSCSDSTSSDLCRTPQAIRRELAMLPAWAVTKRGGTIEFWLGQGGQVVTAVSYSDTLLSHVKVERRIPAPF